MKIIHKKGIGEVHFQHTIWMNQLTFYKEELKIFQTRLEEIASKNTGKDIRVSIEQFQNKFVIQKNEIDKLEHLIHINEDEAVNSGKIHIRRIDYEATEQYIYIRNAMVQFEKLSKELKDNFYLFLSQWM
ncbi:MAG TPA: hypothetical protein VNW99_04695 [Cytophagaceae bacterium]|jgi:hypothetical protein|nr:hypothetical protein [Cytophagaceae bacterium]